MAALFGQSGDGRREPKSLVEFRAGKMKLTGSTVTADTRKGLAFMKMEDGLLHFLWKDRKTGEVVDDFIIFAGDAEMKRVPQCTTGRVFLLKFRDSTTRRFFYWLQEPKEEKDEDLLKKVNDLIANPPDPSAGDGGGHMHGLPQALLGAHGSQLQSLLGMGGPQQQQLMEQLMSSSGLGPPGGMLSPYEAVRSPSRGSSAAGGTRSSTGTTATSSGSAPGATPQPPRQQQPQPRQLQLGDLQNILSSMNLPQQQEGEGSQVDPVSLSEVVTADVLRPLAVSTEAQDHLSPHLPPSQESPQEVLTSPQFQQALGVFGSALHSGQLGPLMAQFGMGEEVARAASTGDVQGFAEALQSEMGGGAGTDQSGEGGEGVQEPPEEDKGGEEDMEEQDKEQEKSDTV